MRSLGTLIRNELRDVGRLALGLALLAPALALTLRWSFGGEVDPSVVFLVILPALMTFCGIPVATTLIAGATGSALDARWLAPAGRGSRFLAKFLVAGGLSLGFLLWALLWHLPLIDAYIDGDTEGVGASTLDLARRSLPGMMSFVLLGGVLIAVAAWLASFLRHGFQATLLVFAGVGVVVTGVAGSGSVEHFWWSLGLASPDYLLQRLGMQGVAAGGVALGFAWALGCFLAWRPRQVSVRRRSMAWALGLIPPLLGGVASAGTAVHVLTEWQRFDLHDDGSSLLLVEADPSDRYLMLTYASPGNNIKVHPRMPGNSSTPPKTTFLDLDDDRLELDLIEDQTYQALGWGSEGNFWLGKTDRSGELTRVAGVSASDSMEVAFERVEDWRTWTRTHDPRLWIMSAGPRWSSGAVRFQDSEGLEGILFVEWDGDVETIPWPGMVNARAGCLPGQAMVKDRLSGLSLYDSESGTRTVLLGLEETGSKGLWWGRSLRKRWMQIGVCDDPAVEDQATWSVRLVDPEDPTRVHGPWELLNPTVEFCLGVERERHVLLRTESGLARVDLDTEERVDITAPLLVGAQGRLEWDLAPSILSDGRLILVDNRRIAMVSADGREARLILDLDAPAATIE